MKLKATTTSFTGDGMGIYSQECVFEEDLKNTENQVVNLYPEKIGKNFPLNEWRNTFSRC